MANTDDVTPFNACSIDSDGDHVVTPTSVLAGNSCQHATIERDVLTNNSLQVSNSNLIIASMSMHALAYYTVAQQVILGFRVSEGCEQLKSNLQGRKAPLGALNCRTEPAGLAISTPLLYHIAYYRHEELIYAVIDNEAACVGLQAYCVWQRLAMFS